MPACGSDVAVTDVSEESPAHVTVQVVGLDRDSAYACAQQVTAQALDSGSKLLAGHDGHAINPAFPASFVMTQQVTHGEAHNP